MTRVLPAMVLILALLPAANVRSQSQARPRPVDRGNRLPPIAPEDMTEAQKKAVAEYARVRPDAGIGGNWAIDLRIPDAMGPIRQLHEQAHMYSRLPQPMTHLVMLITARYWTNDIWGGHDDDAVREGLKPELIKALEEGRRPERMSEDEGIIYDLCIELLVNQSVTDKTYNRAVARFGEEGIVQAGVTMGLYSMYSLIGNLAQAESAPHPGLKPFEYAREELERLRAIKPQRARVPVRK